WEKSMAVSRDSRSPCSRRSSSWRPGSSIPHSSGTSRSTWRRRTPTSPPVASWRSGRRGSCKGRSWTGFTRWCSRTGRSRPGRAHHALADAVTLARVYRELERQRGIRARKAVLANLLDYLGLALALEPRAEAGGERETLFKLAKFYTLGRYSDALAFYETERERTGRAAAPPVDEVIQRLGGRALLTRLRAEPDPAQRYPAALARLRALMDEPAPPDPLSPTGRGGTLGESIDRLLERVALSTSEGIEG